MWLNYTNDVVLNGQGDLPPSVVGVAALPAGPKGRRNEVNAGMWAISSQVKDPKKLEACWRFIRFFAGDEAARVNTAKCVELGLGTQVNPVYLKKFGYEDLLANVDPSYVEANLSLFQTGHPEPYGRNCQQVYAVLDDALDRARLEPGTPAATILADDGAGDGPQAPGLHAEGDARASSGLGRRGSWRSWVLGCLALGSYRTDRSYRTYTSYHRAPPRRGLPQARLALRRPLPRPRRPQRRRPGPTTPSCAASRWRSRTTASSAGAAGSAWTTSSPSDPARLLAGDAELVRLRRPLDPRRLLRARSSSPSRSPRSRAARRSSAPSSTSPR